MKTLKTSFSLFAISLSLIFCASAYTSELSPAIDIIKNKTKFIKSGIVQSDVVFSAEDFDKGFGIKVKKITVKTLPPVKEGILKLSGLAVASGQEIPREKIGTLKFVPNAKNVTQSSFTVFHSNDENTVIQCRVSLSDGVNFSPTASRSVFSTQRNIILCKTLEAFDPEDDVLQYEIVSAPKNGILTLKSNQSGTFTYYPNANYCGNDSFEYRVVDVFGNVSEPEKVKIKIEKPSSNIYFSDMTTHWAHNSAIKTASRGVIPISYNTDGHAIFNPEEKVSRMDFLVSAMKASKYKPDTELTSTAFIDDHLISNEAKCYIATAYRAGIISGYASPKGLAFDPKGEITRAQAAVIISKLIVIPEADTAPVFADSENIPAWAQNAMGSLVSCGIISGTGNGKMDASMKLTKAQSAELLSSVTDYQKKTSRGGFFSWLFK